MIIDAHQHAFWHAHSDAGLIADLDEQGIDQAWLLTWEIPPDEDNESFHRALNPAHVRPDGTHPGLPLSDAVITRDRYPDRFVLGYCPDPRLKTAPQLFESAVRIHGVRVCGEWKFRTLVDDPRCLNLFRAAGALGCPVTIHLDVPFRRGENGAYDYAPSWYGGTIDNLERTLIACRDTNFLGHAPGFWREISGNADDDPASYPTGPIVEGGKLYRVLDANPNLYLDLSAASALRALKRDSGHAHTFLCRYADRILFARDFFGGDLKAFLGTLDLPAEVQEKMYHRNAQKLLGEEAAKP